MRRVGDGCAVTACWQAGHDRERSVAELLLDGYRQLGGREGAFTIAGGQGGACGLADVEMPNLRQEEMRSALAFELKRHAPVSADKLAWGYRVMSGGGGGKRAVRLYFLRRNTWEKWVEDVSGIGQVDMLAPPPVGLDPLLADRRVFVGDPDGNGFTYIPLEDGRREVAVGIPEGESVFGTGAFPLDSPELDSGPLAELTPDERRGFVPAVLLGMYGMTSEFTGDVHTGIPLPHNLRPRRHRMSRLVALGLLVYAVVMGSVGMVREVQGRRAELAEIGAEVRKVESEIERVGEMIDPDATQYIASLGREMSDAYTDRPSMTIALLELTRTIGESAWCQSLEWRDGSVIIQLKEEEEDVELVKSLEFSAVLGDVVQISKAVGPGGDVVRRFQMNARYDIDGERRVSSSPETDRSEPEGEAADDADADVPGNTEDASSGEGGEAVSEGEGSVAEPSEAPNRERDDDGGRPIIPPPPPPPPPGG